MWPRVLSELEAADGKAWDPSILDFLTLACYVCTDLACEQAMAAEEAATAVTCREQLFVVQDNLTPAVAPASAASELQTLQIGGALVGSEQGITVDDDGDDERLRR
jgi:hypothetical protein